MRVFRGRRQPGGEEYFWQEETGSRGTPGIHVVVGDVAAHHARASAAGTEIVFGPEETEWGYPALSLP